MEKLQLVKDKFENLTENEKINYWNDYCDENSYFGDKIYCLNGYELEVFFNSIEEFAKSINNSEHFNYNDNYFTVGDVYNDIKTADYFDELAYADDNFFEWILENNPDFIEDEEEKGEENEEIN